MALIGTTDIPYEGKPENVTADEDEITYLMRSVNRYFKQQLTRADVVHAFSGVRPLYDDNADNPSAVTRDYIFEVDAIDGKAPMLSVFGGKITTFRKLAEHALDRIGSFFPKIGPAWTAKAVLPGGNMPDADFDQFLASVRKQYDWIPATLLKHLARLYGSRLGQLLDGATSLAKLGQQFGPDFYEAEARFLMKTEWALEPADILERRTKHGLHMTDIEKMNFELWFESVISVQQDPQS